MSKNWKKKRLTPEQKTQEEKMRGYASEKKGYCLFILILVFIGILSCNAQTYKITWKKAGAWSAYTTAGMLWGGREAYHADACVFEKAWGVDKYSFFGSSQWERNYLSNRYKNLNGEINLHKDEVFGNFGRDYWHTAGYSTVALSLGATFIIGNSKQKLKHKLIDLLIGSTCFMLSSNLTYKLLKK